MKLEEMNKALLQTKVQEFIRTFEGDSLQLSFSKTQFANIANQELIQQIEGFKKTKKKLPTWHKTKGIYYPAKLNLEQTSSEITAAYKSTLLSGKTIVDLTGGFGIDSFYFSKFFASVTHVEIDPELSEIAAHNFKVLAVNSIVCISEDGMNHIQKNNYDVIYLDPLRRDNHNKRVYHLADCLPNVIEHLELLLNQGKRILIKTSPLLDITLGIKELKYAQEVHIVAVQNEVKELVWILSKKEESTPEVIAVNLIEDKIDRFQFTYGEYAETTYSNPLTYLFEPNAALMKAGAFGKISKDYKMHKLAPNSHLFTSEINCNFPGRSFKILEVLPYSKKELKRFSKKKANIATRNFKERVDTIRKKFKILEGGDTYLFFTTLVTNEKVVLVTIKVE